MNNVYAELKKLIDRIQLAYVGISNEWIIKKGTKINLKKLRVSDIDKNDCIYKDIIEYVKLLNERNASLMLELPYICSYKVTARIKAQNSIEYKIQHYITSKREAGKVPVNKCINDLFGVRVILDIPLSFEETHEFIENNYPQKYRCVDASKYDYKAIHLYFNDNNYTFPWELQIWSICDVKNNFNSHKKYKQEYTSWEKENKEGGES